MGHANLTNISTFFLRELHERGEMSVKECVGLMVEAKVYVSASEGKYYDEYMLAMSLTEVLDYLLTYREGRGKPVVPVIEALGLDEDQSRVLEEWKEDGESDIEEDLEKFDEIVWRYTATWQDRWEQVEPLGSVTN